MNAVGEKTRWKMLFNDKLINENPGYIPNIPTFSETWIDNNDPERDGIHEGYSG